MRASLALAAILLSLAVACGKDDEPTTLGFYGSQSRLSVEVADSQDELERGLSGREALGEDQGMLLVFPPSLEPKLWMRDTTIPLSAAFLGDDGTILEIVTLEPHSRVVHESPSGSRYALEVNAGWFSVSGISKGDRVDLTGVAELGQDG